ncbi:hypothetical protein CCACVL1_21245 [Corchorus capsularis]|uniref:Agenet domain-containing protein n=1 Tax=Corchorus capsularis TaxID=210143 RepID=A0A1R3H7Q1_COCAP|nr:hypothetical protein CCACVL1_21245 [Corchorus capsularis]
MAFEVGDKVEVCSKVEGFVGSYYEARVVSKLNDGGYKVRYKNLVEEEDHSRLLVEKVSADEVRPMPPRIGGKGTQFSYFEKEKVDAFDNDGWWVGNVTGKDDSKYWVYFETTGDHIAYPVSRLRKHLDWSNGFWVLPDPRRLLS